MLNAKEAKKIGISACIEKLGVEFCRKYEANACTSWGRRGNKMHCSVGIDERSSITEKNLQKLILSRSGFQYVASCNVDMRNGAIEFGECRIPLQK